MNVVVSVFLVTSMPRLLRAVCVLELLYMLKCAVRLLLLSAGWWAVIVFDVVVASGRSATTTSLDVGCVLVGISSRAF